MFTPKPRGLHAIFCPPEPGQIRSVCATYAHTEHYREYHREKKKEEYRKAKATPGGMDKYRAKNRRDYHKRCTTLAGRAKEASKRSDNYYKKKKNDPQWYADMLVRMKQKAAEKLAANPKPPKPPKPTSISLAGSVLAAASPSALGREILDELVRTVPRTYERPLREEIIGVAALMVVEGMSIPEAIEKARRAAVRSDREFRYVKPIDQCFWL